MSVHVFMDTHDNQRCTKKVEGETLDEIRDQIVAEVTTLSPSPGWPKGIRRVAAQVPVMADTTIQSLALTFDIKVSDIARANGGRGQLDGTSVLVPVTAREYGPEVLDLVESEEIPIQTKVHILMQATNSYDPESARACLHVCRGNLTVAIDVYREERRTTVEQNERQAGAAAQAMEVYEGRSPRARAKPPVPKKPETKNDFGRLLRCCIPGRPPEDSLPPEHGAYESFL